MLKIVKIGVALLFLVAGATLFYKKVYLPKSTYQLYHPTKGDISVEVFGIGELDAKDIYKVSTPIGGKILSIKTDQGEYIKKGDLIASLDPVDLNEKLQAAKTAIKRGKIDLESAQKELDIAKNQANLAQSTYQADLRLYKAKGISRLAFKKSKDTMLTAKTQVKLAQSKITSIKMRIQESQINVKGIEKRVEQLTVTSPIDGFVIEKNVLQGQSIPPAFTIVKIVDPKTVWIKTWVDERISGKVKVGQKAKITLRSHEETPYEGVVKRVAAISDGITQEREVDVSFKNTPNPFYIKEQAEVSISVKTIHDIYKIPLSYLVIYKEKKGVWIRKDKKAHFLELSIVAQDAKFAAIKSSIDNTTEILIPDVKKKPLFEGSSISND